LLRIEILGPDDPLRLPQGSHDFVSADVAFRQQSTDPVPKSGDILWFTGTFSGEIFQEPAGTYVRIFWGL